MKRASPKSIKDIFKELKKTARTKRDKTLFDKLRRMIADRDQNNADKNINIKELESRVGTLRNERDKLFDECLALKEKLRATNDLGSYLARAKKGVIIVVTDAETKWKESKQ